MNRVTASTTVYRPPEPVFEFLVDFTGYAGYSKHLQSVTKHGDGLTGTEYDLHFSWWRLEYTLRSRVTEIDPPERIEWEVTRDVDAHGWWAVEPTDPPADVDHASRVTLVVSYDPHSARKDAIDLPRFVSTDWLIDRAIDVVRGEAERVVRAIVADLEGQTRPVELRIQREH